MSLSEQFIFHNTHDVRAIGQLYCFLKLNTFKKTKIVRVGWVIAVSNRGKVPEFRLHSL